MYKIFLVEIIVFVLLTGCATTTDPRGGGFFGGLCGISSGEYDKRIQVREDELQYQKDVHRGLDQKSQNLEKDVQKLNKELAKEKQLVAKMEKDIADLKTYVDRMKSKYGKNKAQVDDLNIKIKTYQRQLKNLQTDLSILGNNSGSGTANDRYQILKKERDRLADEYRRLLEYSKALAAAAN